MIDYQMLSEGDKICVAVSGGKDSLTMLRILQERRKFVPVKYSLLAVHVDMGYKKEHARMLEKYLKKQGVEYHIEKIKLLKPGQSLKDISCFWCSWNRRKTLFQVADRLGCTKVALGHHKDDIVETILMNMFFQGEISAMKPKQELFKGKIKIIRPLAYVDEDLIIKYARSLNFPTHKCDCPNSPASMRSKMTQILKDLQKICPEVKTNVFKSVKRIKSDYLL